MIRYVIRKLLKIHLAWAVEQRWQIAVAREEADHFELMARDYANNAEFYRDIVIEIGEMFGDAAKTSLDGTIQEDVLALKVPELVRKLIEEKGKTVEI